MVEIYLVLITCGKTIANRSAQILDVEILVTCYSELLTTGKSESRLCILFSVNFACSRYGCPGNDFYRKRG